MQTPSARAGQFRARVRVHGSRGHQWVHPLRTRACFYLRRRAVPAWLGDLLTLLLVWGSIGLILWGLQQPP